MLHLNLESSILKLQNQGVVINTLKETRSEGLMHLDDPLNNLLSDRQAI